MKTHEVQSKLGPFLGTVALAREAILFLDYDGTLAPFRVQRGQAVPYPGVVPILQEIMRNDHTRVIVISGREVNELPLLLNIRPRPEFWGVHGLQRLKKDGTTATLHIDEPTLSALSDAGRWVIYQQIKHTAEFKPGSIAVHWRGLSDLDREDLRARVLLGWRLIAQQSSLDILEFDGGVEIRVPNANKGGAIRAFLKDVVADTPVAYLGDDATDESAFHAIGTRGLSVLVRPEWRETAAQVWLKPPDQLIDFLDLWLQSSMERKASGGGAAKAVNG